MPDEPVEEIGELLDELRWLGPKLVEALSKPMARCDLAPLERTEQLYLVVAREHRARCPLGHHVHYETQHSRRLRPAVNKVAKEECPSALQGAMPCVLVGRDLVSELA